MNTYVQKSLWTSEYVQRTLQMNTCVQKSLWTSAYVQKFLQTCICVQKSLRINTYFQKYLRTSAYVQKSKLSASRPPLKPPTHSTDRQKSLWTCRYVRNIYGPMPKFRNTKLWVQMFKNRCVQVRMIINLYGLVCMIRARYG
jgi:hypothetical protein